MPLHEIQPGTPQTRPVSPLHLLALLPTPAAVALDGAQALWVNSATGEN